MANSKKEPLDNNGPVDQIKKTNIYKWFALLVTVYLAGISSDLYLNPVRYQASDRKDTQNLIVKSQDQLPSPAFFGMELNLLVNDSTKPAWNKILEKLPPYVVNGKLVPQTIDMLNEETMTDGDSEGELVFYWKQTSDLNHFALEVIGSYREKIPIPNSPDFEIAWGIKGYSKEYSKGTICSLDQIELSVVQFGGNHRLPFDITISLKDGRPIQQTFKVRSHSDTLGDVSIADVKLLNR